jgi:hypothetical protein
MRTWNASCGSNVAASMSGCGKMVGSAIPS